MLEQVQPLFSTALLLKFLMAAWIALTLRSLPPNSRGSLFPTSLLCIGGSIAAAFVVYDARSVIFGCTAAIAVFVAFLCLRDDARKPAQPNPKTSRRYVFVAASLLGLGLSIGGFVKAIPDAGSLALLAWVLLIANCIGLASAILFSIELTFYLSPQDIRTEQGMARNLHCISNASLIALGLAAISLASIFLGSGPRSVLDGGLMREEFRLIAWLFAATILMLHVVLWMSVRRALGFGEKPAKSNQSAAKLSRHWSSLAIAGWIATSALLVSLATPAEWPWLVKANSDALIGELLED